MGFIKSSSKREVYSDTIIPQETRKTLNRQPSFTLKQLEKEEQKGSEQTEMKETIVKINRSKSGSLRSQTKLTNL